MVQASGRRVTADYGGFYNVHSVRDYGAVGDGVTDDTQAVKDTVSAVANDGGGTVFFPPGDYVINGNITVGDPFIKVLGNDATLDCTGFTTVEPALTINGWYGNDYAINAASQGDTKVVTSTAADAGNFSAGDLVLVGSSDTFRDSTSDKGEMAVIDEVDSGTGDIFLKSSLYDDYSSTPIVRYINDHKKHVIEGLEINMPGGDYYTGIKLEYVQTAAVRDCKITGTGQAFVSVENSFGVVIHNVTGRDGYFSTTSTSYGVEASNAVTQMRVTDCDLRDVRHAFTNGGTSAKGVPRDIRVENNFGSNVGTEDTANFDTHYLGEDITFRDNVSHGGGFQVRCNGVTIMGNTTRAATDGVTIRGNRQDIIIVNNRLLDCIDDGIDAVQDACILSGIIDDNYIARCGNRGIVIGTCLEAGSVSRNKIVNPTGPAVLFRDIGTVATGYTRRMVECAGNVIYGGGDHGVYFTPGGYTYANVTDNIIEASGTSIYTGDNTNSISKDNLTI